MAVEYLHTTAVAADNSTSSVTLEVPPGGSNDIIVVFAQVVSNTITLTTISDDSVDSLTWTLRQSQTETSPTPDTDRHFWTSSQCTDPGAFEITVNFSGSINTGVAERGWVRAVRFSGVSSSPFGNEQYTYNGSSDSTHTNSAGWTVGSGNLGVHFVVQRAHPSGTSFTPDTGWTEIWEDTGTTGGDLREPASTMNVKTGDGSSEQPTTTGSNSWLDNSVWGFELVADTDETIQVVAKTASTVNLSDGGAGTDVDFDPDGLAAVDDVLITISNGVNTGADDATHTLNGSSTAATNIITGSSDTGLVISRKTLDADDVSNGTVNVARAGTSDLQRMTIHTVVLRFPNGFDSATPEDATTNATSGTSHTAQGYNTTPAAAVGDLKFAFFGTDPISGGETWTSPSGWGFISQQNSNLRPHSLLVVQPVTSAGAQSDATATLSGSGNGGQTTMILLVDAGGGGGTTHAASGSSVGTGTTSATASVAQAASASSTATLTSTASATATRAASGASTGVLSSSGAAAVSRQATASATGTATSSADATVRRAASATATGTLTSSAATTATLAASGSVVGTLTSSGSADVGGTVSASGSAVGTLTTSGSTTVSAAASGSVTGTCSTSGQATVSQAASGSATGTLTSSGNASTSTSQAASGSAVGTATSSAQATIRQAASASATATATSTGTASVRQVAAGTAVCSLVATAAAGVDIKVSASAVATLTTTGNARIPGQSPVILGDTTAVLADDGQRTFTLADDGSRSVTLA